MFKALKEILKDHIIYFRQIFKLAKADLVKTYRGAALGWSWAIIKPCMTIFTYWFAFTFGLRAGKDIGEYPFVLWMIAGMVPWFYMNEMLTQGTESIRKYQYLVTKMKFPISTIPTFVSVSKMYVNILMQVILIIIFWIAGFEPDIYYLQIPLYMLFSFIFFTLYAQFAALIAAMSKDFANLVKSFITPIFWLSGILWDADRVAFPWLNRFLMLNPVTFIVSGYRNALVNKVWFFQQPKRLLYFTCWIIILIVLSLWSYKKLRKDIPDVL